MAVTHMTLRFGPAPKPRPRSGDRKIGKDGVAWIRRCAVFRGTNGRIEGYDCTNGRQRYVWVREGERAEQLAKSDHG